jgi:tetratricopeptide (TPR) repeat protein
VDDLRRKKLGFILTTFAGLGLVFAAEPASKKSFTCHEVIEPLPIASKEPMAYLLAAQCLIQSDSIRGASSCSMKVHPNPADSVLKARLPGEQNWYLRYLERFRQKREIASALQMSYLAALKFPQEPTIFRQLAEVYQMVPDPYRAGLALLRYAELDSTQKNLIQYQLENLIRTAATEKTPIQFLDSLASEFKSISNTPFEVLETLSWGNQNYPGAYKNFLTLLSLGNTEPEAALDRVNRFQSLGYFDYGSAVLEKISWRSLPEPWQSRAWTLFMQIRFQLKDWPAIVTEFDRKVRVNMGIDSPEQNFILATALLKTGFPAKALERLKTLDEPSTPPRWNYRGRILKAQVYLSLGKSKEASETLRALKRDPHRQEGTGPILFWQGCLAIAEKRFASAESLMVLASAYTGTEEAQKALEYRFYLIQDTSLHRSFFFNGLAESPYSTTDRLLSLEKIPAKSSLWPFAQLEKAQILVQIGQLERAEAVLENAARQSPDRLAGLQAEAKAAFLQEKLPGGKQAALARYEDLLIKYQQGVIPEFSRERIKALK